MTGRSRLLLVGAAVVGPLALFPVLLVQPVLGLLASVAVVAVWLASRSVAWPLALAAVPDIVTGLHGSNPFPPKASLYITTGWVLLGLLIALLRGEDVLPLRLLTSPPVLLTLALVVLMLIRLGGSRAPDYGSLKVQLFVATSVIGFFGGIAIARFRERFDLWVVLALTMALLSGLTLMREILLGQADTSVGGRFALFQGGGPIQLGREAAVGLLLGTYVLLARGSVRRRIFGLAAVPILVVMLLSAGSRGPMLALVVGVVVLLALSLHDRAARRRLVLVALGLVVAVILVPQLVPGQNLHRSLGILLGGDVNGSSGRDSNGRFRLYGEAWGVFTQHPLTGIGTGSFAAISPVEHYPHNLVLESLVEYGLIGGAILVGILASGVRSAVGVWRRTSTDDRPRAALLLALLATAITNSLVSGGIENTGSLWLALGLAVGLGDGAPIPALRLALRRKASPADQSLVEMHARVGLREGSAPGSGAVVAPAAGAVVRGRVRVSAVPAETGWAVSSLQLECSADGSDWFAVGEAPADDSYDVFLVSRGAAVRRRHVAVVRTRERAEQVRQTLEMEHAGGPEQVEIAASKRKPWTTGESHGARWDTTQLPDGPYRLRAVTTDIAAHTIWSPQVQVTVDNVPPSVRLEWPPAGASVAGSTELLARATDAASGVARVRFELDDGSDWVTLGTVIAEPFRLAWDAGLWPEGRYRLRAVAVDGAGNEAQSGPIAFTVRHAAEAVAPQPEPEPAKETLTGEIELTGPAEDGVEWVAFELAPAGSFEWRPLGRADAPPFGLPLDTRLVPNGEYDVRSLASRGGEIEYSRPAHVLIENEAPAPSANGASHEPLEPPRAWLQTPSSGAVAEGLLRLEAGTESSLSIGAVRFQCSADGLTWTDVASLRQAPYAAEWDTTAVEDGLYWLRCLAYDLAGREAASDVVPVHVANVPPEPEPEPPAEPETLWDLQQLLDGTHPSDARYHERAALLQVLRSLAPPDGRIPDHFRALVRDAFGGAA